MSGMSAEVRDTNVNHHRPTPFASSVLGLTNGIIPEEIQDV